MTEKKTPFRKNLDPRYISGEDLLTGESMGKGLRPEMVVTLIGFKDAPAFDQSLQKEVDKTALWLKDFNTGKELYKPCLMNVTRAEFLAKELANGSLYIDDCDQTKPFVIYAKPDKRHGHVVAFKKYFAPPEITDKEALAVLSKAGTLDELAMAWKSLSGAQQKLPTVLAKKEQLKTELK